MARNVDMRVEGSTLWIGVDLTKEGQASKSGKTKVIASTEGNISLSHDGAMYKVGLNVYQPNE
jgi:hypothetical protein